MSMTMLESTQQKKKQRMDTILGIIKANKIIDFKKLIGLMAVQYGIKTATSRIYVRELRDAEIIIVNDGVISLTEEYKKQIGLVDEHDKKLQGTKKPK